MRTLWARCDVSRWPLTPVICACVRGSTRANLLCSCDLQRSPLLWMCGCGAAMFAFGVTNKMHALPGFFSPPPVSLQG